MTSDTKEQECPEYIDWMLECRKWESECRKLAARLEDVESDGRRSIRMRNAVIRRMVEVRSDMLDAIHANDCNQYDYDIQAMRHTIDELLNLLVEFDRSMEVAG